MTFFLKKIFYKIPFLLFLMLSPSIKGEEEIYFKGQKRSLIKWKGMKEKEWLDFKKWRAKREERDLFPPWENLKRERRLKERIGHVIDCRGDCSLLRGLGKNRVQFRSTLKEGDEIQTSEDSYLWIFLLDGTMVRLSPQTSLTLREINLTKKEVFVHVRVNYGNLLWLSRDNMTFENNNKRETDTLFHPIPLFEALPRSKKEKINEDDLFTLFDNEDSSSEQIKRLNHLIEKNRSFYGSKRSLAFLVMPNATLFGESLKTEIVVLLGGETYIKKRDFKQLGLKKKVLEGVMSEVFLRGYENKSGHLIEENQWYRVDPRGMSFVVMTEKEAKKFALGELMTKNIPTLLLTRELFLRRYSWFVFNSHLESKELAERYGFRLWKNWSEKGKGIRVRVNFLKEYTRRVETTNLKESLKLRKRLLKRGENVRSMIYDKRFYKKAIQSYYKHLDYQSDSGSDKEVLNSTLNPFWGKVNAYKK